MSIPADIGLSSQLALKRKLAIITNNMANKMTPGFQEKHQIFGESEVKATMTRQYSFVKDLATIRDLTPGKFVSTGNPLHAYISGRAYFAVQTPQGVRYTRAGAFTMNERNELVTPQGYNVMDQGNSPIILPEGATTIKISSDGTISHSQGQIGQLGLFEFGNEQLLRDDELGNNLLNSTEAPTTATKSSVGEFGYEGSNVNEIRATYLMLELAREYQQIQKFSENQGRMQTQLTQNLLKISQSA